MNIPKTITFWQFRGRFFDATGRRKTPTGYRRGGEIIILAQSTQPIA